MSTEKKVLLHLPLLRGVMEDDVYVNVNGRSYLIRRGCDVEVPESVVEAIRASERAQVLAEAYMRQQQKPAVAQ